MVAFILERPLTHLRARGLDDLVLLALGFRPDCTLPRFARCLDNVGLKLFRIGLDIWDIFSNTFRLVFFGIEYRSYTKCAALGQAPRWIG